MINQGTLENNERSFLNFRRALSDIKTGIPIYIKELDILIASPETISDNFFNRYFTKNSYLLISKSRSKYLGLKSTKIDLSNISLEEIYKLLDNNPKIRSFKYLENNFSSDILEFMKLIELLPTAIISQDTNPGFLEIELSDLKKYKYELKDRLEIVSKANLSLRHHQSTKIELVFFRSTFINYEHYAIIVGDVENHSTPFVRMHSSCFTGDVLGSLLCDCMDQLHIAIHFLAQNGGGIIIYVDQEGRGIGLASKLRTYNLQSKQGLDTFDANLALGYKEDEREFNVAVQMLAALSVASIKLITNNPKKSAALQDLGINVEKSYNLDIDIHEFNKKYLKAKADKMGHMVMV